MIRSTVSGERVGYDNKPNENGFDENAKKRRKRRTNISRVVSFNESSDHDLDYDNEDDDPSHVDYDNEDNVDISAISDIPIHSPQVAEADIEPLTLEEWEEVKNMVEIYQLTIPINRHLYNPLFYYIIIHSGQHGPTTTLLR